MGGKPAGIFEGGVDVGLGENIQKPGNGVRQLLPGGSPKKGAQKVKQKKPPDRRREQEGKPGGKDRNAVLRQREPLRLMLGNTSQPALRPGGGRAKSRTTEVQPIQTPVIPMIGGSGAAEFIPEKTSADWPSGIRELNHWGRQAESPIEKSTLKRTQKKGKRKTSPSHPD